MKNGLLYEAINGLLNTLKYLNLVEAFKFIASKFVPQKKSRATGIKYSRLAVDIFIIMKWLFIFLLWIFRLSYKWQVIFVWYLLLANLYTYFYYHAWSSDFLEDIYFDIDRIKRRFFNLLLAISFSIFGFAYLYNVPYYFDFNWGDSSSTFIKAIWYSLSNSLTASFNQVTPETNIGNSISMIQLIMMFFFLTIIIGGSIPQPNLSVMED